MTIARTAFDHDWRVLMTIVVAELSSMTKRLGRFFGNEKAYAFSVPRYHLYR